MTVLIGKPNKLSNFKVCWLICIVQILIAFPKNLQFLANGQVLPTNNMIAHLDKNKPKFAQFESEIKLKNKIIKPRKTDKISNPNQNMRKIQQIVTEKQNLLFTSNLTEISIKSINMQLLEQSNTTSGAFSVSN